jgi:urea carboxylase
MSKHEGTAPKGQAIEVPIYAENPAEDYRPAQGRLSNVEFPTGDGIRVDDWVENLTWTSDQSEHSPRSREQQRC